MFREYATEFWGLATVANNTGKELATRQEVLATVFNELHVLDNQWLSNTVA